MKVKELVAVRGEGRNKWENMEGGGEEVIGGIIRMGLDEGLKVVEEMD